MKSEKEDDDKSDKQDKRLTKKENTESKKALFMQWFIAFCIDILIISFITSFVVFPFYDGENSTKLNEEANRVITSYYNEEISFNEYLDEFMSISYQLAKNDGLIALVGIIIEILYFVVYQLYKNGQTIGKKLMKIKVISIKNELTMNQMIFRALLINSILLELISFGFMLFSSKEVYFYGVGIFEIIQSIIIVSSALMIMYSKNSRGIHDLVTHTEVIKL